MIDDPARWHVDYDRHVEMCYTRYGSGKNAAEQQFRDAKLNECASQSLNK